MPSTFSIFVNGDVIQAFEVSEMHTPIQNLERGAAFYAGASAGTSTAYTATMTPAPDNPYQAGMMVNFKVHTQNAAGSPDVTLNVNGVGAKPIKKNGGVSLAAGDLKANQIVSVILDPAGTQAFQILSVSSVSALAFSNSQNGPWSYIGPDGTAGTYFTTASGETLPTTPAFQGRYARFQARLSSTDGLHTPTFGNVHLSFTGAGLLASSCRNFVYDPAGNTTSIETVTDAGTTLDDRNPVAHPINALNQILQRDVGGVSWLFSYDLNGNLTGKTNGTDTFIYTWSDENRLDRVQGPGGLDVSYTYDTSGRMMTRTSGGVTTRLTWDGWDCVREETGSSVTLYHIPDGMLHSFSLNGVVYQVHACALGSVRMITDASGAVVARLEYGAWGEEIFVSTIPALQNFPYRFVGILGVRTDEKTGLVYMRERWYSSQLQRFISRDPLATEWALNSRPILENILPEAEFRHSRWKSLGFRREDITQRVTPELGNLGDLLENLMVYARNNPVKIADPMGLQPSECRLAVFGQHITKKMFRQACEDAGWPAVLCEAMSKKLQGTTCNTIAQWCEHLQRHGGDGLGKKAIEACLAAYIQLCQGQ